MTVEPNLQPAGPPAPVGTEAGTEAVARDGARAVAGDGAEAVARDGAGDRAGGPSTTQRLIRRFRRHVPGQIGVVLILLLICVALAAPLIAPTGYDAQDLTKMRAPPSAEHWFGTDRYGRDVFDRVVWGSRIALRVALIVVAIQLAVGVTLGLLAGYFGGWTDRVISALIDLVWAFPPLVLALGLIAALGPGLENVIIAIAITSWAPFARVTRAKTMSLRQRD